MPEETGALVVLSTVPDAEKGREIARALVEARLAACATLSSPCESYYWWEGKISQDKEWMLFIKTRTDLFSRLEEKLKSLHPYSVPEIIALPVTYGSAKYLDWIKEETHP